MRTDHMKKTPGTLRQPKGEKILNEPAAFETSCKVSTMVNPDGSTTVRRKVLYSDGTSGVTEEELPCIETSDMPTLQLSESDSISSITDQRTYQFRKMDASSVASSKEDVFAGIESDESLSHIESPKRPARPANTYLSSHSEKENSIGTNKLTPLESSKHLSRLQQISDELGVSNLQRSNAYNGDKYVRFPLHDQHYNIDREKLHDQSDGVHELTVSVFKRKQNDKIGINLGMQRLVSGEDNLVVSNVASNGLFAEGPIQRGDRVISINDCRFDKDPQPAQALDIVRQATGKITFVVQKRVKKEIPSIQRSAFAVRRSAELGQAVTTEIRNEDGTSTVIVDHFDEKGAKIRTEIRRKKINAENGGSLNSSGSYISPSDHKEDTRAKKVVVRKTSKDQHIGLKLMTLNTPSGPSVFVSDIRAFGLIAQARNSLSRGDEILNINGFDFRKDPNVEIANSIIRNSVGDLTILARGFEKHFGDFSQFQDERTVETEWNGAVKRKEESKSFDFDELSYGGSISSIGSYMSSNVIRISKADPTESVGVIMTTKTTAWGALLMVSSIHSSSKLANSELRVGDVILAINGISFSENPDAAKALSILQAAREAVIIEYQRLSNLQAVMLWKKQQEKAKRSEIINRSQRLETMNTSTVKSDKNTFSGSPKNTSKSVSFEIKEQSWSPTMKLVEEEFKWQDRLSCSK